MELNVRVIALVVNALWLAGVWGWVAAGGTVAGARLGGALAVSVPPALAVAALAGAGDEGRLVRRLMLRILALKRESAALRRELASRPRTRG